MVLIKNKNISFFGKNKIKRGWDVWPLGEKAELKKWGFETILGISVVAAKRNVPFGRQGQDESF